MDKNVARSQIELNEKIAEWSLKEKNHKILRKMTAFCPGCNTGGAIFESFIDDERLVDRCQTCKTLYFRLQKCYFKHFLDNPIHIHEEILHDTEEFREACQDKEIDIKIPPQKSINFLRGGKPSVREIGGKRT